MSTPAEKYAAARERSRSRLFAEFVRGFEFPLDAFQERACHALEAGRGVLLAAPTGAGKTVVGEFAVHLALSTGCRAFYTAPIKALSNQKYADLSRRYGSEKVGLLTGDSSINGNAPVVVMTTEVLRNMLYVDSPALDDLGFVVMDEVHYLADRFRGAVWEEVIIHLPERVQVVSLSATVSNAEEFGAWLGEVRGDTEVVVEEYRPVPLWQHMMVGREVFDLFVEDQAQGRKSSSSQHHASIQVNPELVEAIERRRRGTQRRGRLEDLGGPRGRRGNPRGRSGDSRGSHDRHRHGRHRGAADEATESADKYVDAGPRQSRQVSRAEMIERLDREGLLPAITFIFSRAGCDAAVQQLLAADTVLVSWEESETIRRLVEERIVGIAPEDLDVLGYWDFVEGLSRGFAAHHAGMLPTFREIVEELFTAGHVRVVFATETLALGINMPARSVVLEKLVKFNGESHADITPAEYTQLTGRAGRRGIDVEGHAVVLWNGNLDPLAVGGLASTRTYPLRSSFRPNPNMAVNLVAAFGQERARAILETSFAQFQADRSVVGLTRSIRRHEEALAGYAEAMTCHLGDFEEYSGIRRQISDLEKGASRARSAGRRAAVDTWLQSLQEGDVLFLQGGRRSGRGVVVSAAGRGRDPMVTVVSEDGRSRRVTGTDLTDPGRVMGRMTIPRSFHPRVVKDRRDLAATLRARFPAVPMPETDEPAENTTPGQQGDLEAKVTELRRRLRAHPCHGCPDREHHARWAERWWSLERETATLRRKIAGRTSSVARTFDRICDVLVGLGYLDERGMNTTASGELLRRIYNERDLLVAECLRLGHWVGLSGPELAATVSALIHEARRDDMTSHARLPGAAVEAALRSMDDSWAELDERMEQAGLPRTSAPDPGIAWMVHRWASGSRLESVLRDSDLAAGDFVRRCKQLVDLLDQIAAVAPQPTLAAAARNAVAAVRRGVVAADRLD